MKKTLTTFLLAVASAAAVYGGDARTPAFPGAEGFGRYATGGRAIDARGSRVYYVTRLDDCTDADLVEGTLRWALRTGDDTPRTILFRVSGTIYLERTLSMNHPNVSILGQSAPGGGVCIAGYTLKVNKPNVVLRYLRFRAGDLPDRSMTSLDVENTRHVIIDHCSMTWSMEENLTLYDTDSTTVQWCIISEGLYRSKNAKGARCYATQWGGEHGTMHHCLISNVNNRTPRFNGMRKTSRKRGEHDQMVDNEFVNNVVFNWGKPNSLYGGECYDDCREANVRLRGEADGATYNRVYLLGNYFRPGPNTLRHVADRRYFVWASSTKGRGLGQWLLRGNRFELGSRYAPATAVWADRALRRVNRDNLWGFADSLAARAFDTEDGAGAALYARCVLHEQPVSSGLRPTSARRAFQVVCREAGCALPRYDEVDRRLLDEAAGRVEPRFFGLTAEGTMERAPGIINSQNDVLLARPDERFPGWPALSSPADAPLPADTDGDGLPDEWERRHHLDPADAQDGARLTASGYSHLEVYLNSLVR